MRNKKQHIDYGGIVKKEKGPKVSLIIPTKNEEKTIARIIRQARPFVDEILVIDGHSTDKTREIARKAGARVELDHGKGKGDGIKAGIQKAKGEILVFIDADGSHHPKDIPKIIKPIVEGKADHVSTSRMKGGSDELHGDIGKFIRMIGSDIITLGINYRFKVRLTDSQNGFRAIRAKVAKELGLRENITTIEHEMIIKTLRKRYRIVEIPAHEYRRQYGESTIKVSRVWFRYIYSWLKYLFF